jgi:hypothetical protein
MMSSYGSDGLMLLGVSSRLVVATVVAVAVAVVGTRLGAGINVGGRPSEQPTDPISVLC